MVLTKQLYHQRGELTQGELAFKYEMDHQGAGLTGMGGIGAYLDLAYRSGMVRSLERHVKARKGKQGWTDAQQVLSLVMLNLVGGECVADVNRLETGEGFCRLPGKAFIPAAKEALKGLCKVNKGMVGFVQNNRSEGERPHPPPNASDAPTHPDSI